MLQSQGASLIWIERNTYLDFWKTWKNIIKKNKSSFVGRNLQRSSPVCAFLESGND